MNPAHSDHSQKYSHDSCHDFAKVRGDKHESDQSQLKHSSSGATEEMLGFDMGGNFDFEREEVGANTQLKSKYNI